MESKVIGQAIIPVCRVLPSIIRQQDSDPKSLPEMSVCEWIELFPLPKDQCRLSAPNRTPP